ncbi:glycoside hydrolase family 2 TIM barrel-domain containing protein [Faecalibacterium sp. An192]|uniref:glycoside hydrolase family 2 TIM barrel-domain containing protein n=1 Tax=Faecalibacterium sp. An192 TaxID=1965581 RepID=UPI000B397262|nr:glycoside hydrolase family 2 TIM barrel-domain containing protein [Faecalibacterium sp. An192]OUP27709.1 beta-galactosidase [Faecalibacterium sp. An192]
MNASRPELSWLEDPRVFAVNRLDAHSDHTWYDAAGDGLRQSLDGPWQFAYSPCPDQRPADFWQAGACLDGFGEIAVPGHIELQGYGQIQYINTMYPWDGRRAIRPPQIAWEDTAVGSYVKTFVLDQALQNKRVCVSFQGVERAFYCWCNGQFVGYSEDSFTPADFDLTPYLQEGENRLCVEVYKHCSGSWLEDQDFFRFFGIFRPVYLYAKPALHIEDLWLRAGLETDNTTGTLSPRLRLSAAQGASLEGCTLQCTVTAPGGGVIWDGPMPLQAAEDGFFYGQPVTLPRIRKWDHSDPALYQITLTLRNAAGEVQETVPYETGFRRFGMNQGVMELNGQRIIFNGVNRHEWSAEAGRAIGPEDMFRAMETFRRNNINAVRTCHYPNQTLWYHLCDQNGIYMIDEANLESHGSWQKMGAVEPSWNVPGSLPEWKDCVVDRARSMFERDKNHTAVLIWSCGNESYAGEDILAMSDFFHANDPGRLVHYEGVFHCRAFDRISDMESRMYAKPDEIRAYLESKPAKPFILCEYMHDMGNSLGGMESYIRLIDEYPQYQGGFIWDYMDQALWQDGPAGRRLGYGGDFGERPTDYAFCGNGIVFADGAEKPAMQEARYWYDTPAHRAAHDAENARRAAACTLPALRAGGPLTITEGDVNLGVRGDRFELQFSYTEGGLASLRTADGNEWIWRAPRPALWRAATENDKGCGFPIRSGAWMAADAYPQVTGWKVEEKTASCVRIRYTFAFPSVPGTSADILYTVTGSALRVDAHYHGAESAPELPVFGVRLSTLRPAARVCWTGLSGETYPDRFRGATFGRWAEEPHIPAYLVPQDCGVHMGTHTLTLEQQDTARRTTSSLTVQMADGKPFAFSALPYTAQELENAAHQDELPPVSRTVLTVMGAVRGVGGIDSWGTDVEPAYHISGQEDHTTSFLISFS